MDKIFAIGGVVLLAFVLFGNGDLFSTDPAPAPDIAAPSPQVPPRAGNGSAQFVADREADGHFYANVRVNGATIRMMVDTGASRIVLTRQDARRAGIQARSGEFTAVGRTAGGEISLKPVVIDRVALGPVATTQVAALVSESDIPVSLLGQSFLERVGTVEISNNRMRLR